MRARSNWMGLACLILVLAGGCNQPRDWDTEKHVLTVEQTERQRELVADVLNRVPEIIGTGADKYEELLSLADETVAGDNQHVYVFTTSGASDDGSDGRLEFRVITGVIVDIQHHFLED